MLYFQVTKTDYVISDLQVDTVYKFRVSAKCSAGVGEPSAPVTVVTYGKMFDSS